MMTSPLTRSLAARAAALALTAALATAGPTAVAQPAEASRVAEAKALHESARQLMDKREYAQACPKLEQVVKLVPEAVAAKFHLAECYEGEGKLASAHGAYLQAQAAASRAGQTARAEHGAKRAAELEPLVPRLTVEVPPSLRELPGLAVLRDGERITAAEWGVAILVDPGTHEVTASAAGKEAWRRQVVLAARASERVVVPLLAGAPAPAPPTAVVPSPAPAAAPPPPAPPPADAGDASDAGEAAPLWPWAVGAAGLVLSGVSVGFLIDEQSVQSDVLDHCNEASCESSDGFDPAKANARLDRDFGLFVGFGIAGVVGIGAGVIGLLAAGGPSQPATPSAAISVWGTADAFGAAVRGQL